MEKIDLISYILMIGSIIGLISFAMINQELSFWVQTLLAIPTFFIGFNSTRKSKSLDVIKFEENKKQYNDSQTLGRTEHFLELFRQIEESYRKEQRFMMKSNISWSSFINKIKVNNREIRKFEFSTKERDVILDITSGTHYRWFLYPLNRPDDKYYENWDNRKKFYKNLIKKTKKKFGIKIKMPKY